MALWVGQFALLNCRTAAALHNPVFQADFLVPPILSPGHLLVLEFALKIEAAMCFDKMEAV